MKTRLLLVTGGFLVLAASPAFAVCPDSRYSVGPTAVSLPAPRGGDGYSFCNGFGCGSASVAFDVPAATLSANCMASGDTWADGSVYMVDDFELVGLPAGTPAHLLVNLRLDGDGGWYSPIQGSIIDAAGIRVDYVGDYFHDTLVLAQDVIAGQLFRLTFYGETGGGAAGFQVGARIAGHFSFSNIPAGAAIVSCKGYASDPVVPVHATSWGQLKTLYR